MFGPVMMRIWFSSRSSRVSLGMNGSAERPFDHRMAPFRDGDPVAPVDRRPEIVPLRRPARPARRERRAGRRRRRSAAAVPVSAAIRLPDLAEKPVLELGDLLLGGQHLFLVLLELGREEPLRAHQGLLADVIGRDEVEVRLGHLDVVAEDLVITDLERVDARPFPLPLLEAGDEGFAGAADRPQLVELGVEAVLDDSALGEEKGRLVEDGPVDESRDILGRCPRRRGVSAIESGPRIPPARPGSRAAGSSDRFEGDEVAGMGRRQGDLAGQALQVEDALEALPETSRRSTVLPQPLLDGVQPAVDGRRIDQRLEQPGLEQTAARRR